MAERWEISADGLTYTFRLRANAAWSDGTPVTARDFEYGARRLLAPRLGAAHAENNLFFVEGARDYQAGRRRTSRSVGVKVRDERTLEFTPGAADAVLPLGADVVFSGAPGDGGEIRSDGRAG